MIEAAMPNGARALIVVGLLALLLPAGASAQAVDLTGVWVLDEAASDTLVLEPSDTASTRPSRVRFGYGYPPRSRSIRDPQRMRDAVNAVADPAARIIIAQDDSTVSISLDGAPPITLYPDGRKVRRAWLDEANVEVRVRWDDGVLRIERVLESQVEIRHTLERDGSTLTIATEVDGPILRTFDLRRIYRLQE